MWRRCFGELVVVVVVMGVVGCFSVDIAVKEIKGLYLYSEIRVVEISVSFISFA